MTTNGLKLRLNLLSLNSQFPIGKISLNQFYKQLNATQIHHHYSGFSKTLQIGFAELHGKREAQEDRIAFGTFSDFSYLTEEKRLAVFNRIVVELQHALSVKVRDTGATLCFVMYAANQVYCVNVGDSSAYLAILDSGGYMRRFQRLNTLRHNPSEPDEKIRLIKAGKEKFIHQGRINGLNLSRSMGDVDFEYYGLIHTPDIYSTSISLTAKEKAFLIVACDGLTEADCLFENKTPMHASIEQIVEENQHVGLDKIALQLAQQAYLGGSEDNISILLARIKEENSPTYIAVFDGHGGVACADFLQRNFHDTAERVIKEYETT